MRKWNWLKGIRCVAGIGATMLVAGTAVAGDGIADPDAVFQQTSLLTSCGADGSCGAGDKDDAGCRSGGCDGGLSSLTNLLSWGGDGLCCNQEEFKLFEGVDVGGWAQLGYTSAPTAFNNTAQDSRILLNQGWLYLDKAANSECGEWAWGYHADFVYGADGTNTNSFGNPGAGTTDGHFDSDLSFLRGDRAAWAIPQLYAEISNGDWTVKGGHFYTLHGYEVVQATGNFFFTHAYTMNYAEPFTHTGVMVTHRLNDDTEIYGGWTAGFDTGFDQASGGSNFMGGYSTALTDDLQLTQIMSFGDFGRNFAPPIVAPVPAPLDEDGSFAMSTVFDWQVCDKLNYVFHSDILRTGVYDTFGINQYLIYQVSDCVGAGTRLEWWKSDGRSVNAWTVGLNVKTHANVTIRPEYRYDWSPAGNTNKGIQNAAAGIAPGVDQSQGTFAVDVVITF